jgi:aldose sugar dehydrogenase
LLQYVHLASMMRPCLSITCYALALATAVLAAPPGPVSLPRQNAPFLITPITDFAEPWALDFLPDNRILVTEKAGTLRLVDPFTGTKGQITGVPPVMYGGQGGFGDIAVHPNFDDNSLVYISYVEAGEGALIGAAVARTKLVLDNSGGGELTCLEVIWRQTPKADTNVLFGHRILFSSEDDETILWITSGDRQLGDPAQDLLSNLGKLVRLNDDGTIPEGNPFASQGGTAAQVWSLGFRNSLGIDFDEDGRLWAIEQGPSGGDEIDLIVEGGNYGWPVVSEGDEYNGQPIPDHSTRPDMEAPKAWWTPVIAPSSMIIYKGDLFPAWKGDAIITGLQSQGLVRVALSGTTAQEAERVPLGRRMRAVRESADGTLWTLEDGAGGRLLKHTPLS